MVELENVGVVGHGLALKERKQWLPWRGGHFGLLEVQYIIRPRFC